MALGKKKARMKKTVLYVVRHGESEGNINGDITGANPPLTARGRMQAHELAQSLLQLKIDAVYSSPLVRAHHTAQVIADSRNLPITISPQIKERYFGSLEGKKGDEVRSLYKQKYDAFEKATPEEQLTWKVVDDMESFIEVYNRVIPFFDEITELHIGRSILLVSHAHVLLSLLINLGFATFNELPFGAIKNTGSIAIEKENGVYKISSVSGITKKI